MNRLFSQKKLKGKRFGFTLLELVISTVVLCLLGTMGIIHYHGVVEKSYSAEVYSIFAEARSGYLSYKEEGIPSGWDPEVGSASNADWSHLRMDNPNSNPSAYFVYNINPAARIIRAEKRTAFSAYSASSNPAKWIEMDLDTGVITKSSFY